MQPITLKERLAHVHEAQRVLRTDFQWICDTMDNQVKHALGDAPNSEFIIDPEGKIVRKRAWSNPVQVRADLEELVGVVDEPTKPEAFDIKPFARERKLASGILERAELPTVSHALRIEPVGDDHDTPFYVKLRAEADDNLLNMGQGTMYIGFHLDPIYRVHWNNLTKPLSFHLEVPQHVAVSPSQAAAEKVEEEFDTDPREFLLDVTGHFHDDPIVVNVHYIACDDQETFCLPVTHQYRIFPEFDEDAGWTFARGRPGARTRTVASNDGPTERPVLSPVDTNRAASTETKISGRVRGHIEGWIDGRIQGSFKGRFRGTFTELGEPTFQGQFHGELEGYLRGRIDGELDAMVEGKISSQ